MFFVGKWVHSNSLINVHSEENCRIDEMLCCFDVKVLVCKAMKMFKCWWPKNGPKMVRKWSENGPKMVRKWSENGPNFRGVLTRCFRSVVLTRCFDALFSKRCFDAVFSKTEKTTKCWLKKIGVDWPRPSQFQKKSSKSNVQIEKSAWTGLGKVKKGLFSGKCL